jgi:hypothetical protein
VSEGSLETNPIVYPTIKYVPSAPSKRIQLDILARTRAKSVPTAPSKRIQLDIREPKVFPLTSRNDSKWISGPPTRAKGAPSAPSKRIQVDIRRPKVPPVLLQNKSRPLP